MNMQNFHAHAELRFYSHSITLHLYERRQNGEMSLLSGLQFTTVKEAEMINPQEEITIPIETAQELIDSLWQCGLRPSESSENVGSLKALQDHLKDLQEFSHRLLSIIEHMPLP